MSNEEMIIQLRLYVAGIRHSESAEIRIQRYGQVVGYLKALEDAGVVYGEEASMLRSEIDCNRLRSEHQEQAVPWKKRMSSS